jgi:predicted ester cyclase
VISWSSTSLNAFKRFASVTQRMDVNRAWYGDDFCVIEHQWHGPVTGEFLGVPGNGRWISFRILHIWEFKDGKISRENVWLDGGSIVEQLTAGEPVEAAV